MPEIFRLRPCPHAHTRKRATTHPSRKSTKTKSVARVKHAVAARGPRVKHAVAARGPRVKHVTYVPVVTWGVKRPRSITARTSHGPSRTKAILVKAMAGKSYRDAPWKKSSAKIVRSAVRRKLASADLRYPSRVTARRFDDTRRRLVGSVNFRTRPRKSTPKRRVFPTDDRRTPSPRAKLVRQLLGEALAGPQKPEVKKSMNMLADLANPGYPKSKAKAAKGIYRWSAERPKRADAPKASKTDIAKRLMKAAGGKPAALAEAAVEMVKNVATASAKKVERAAAAQAAPRRGERSRKQPSRYGYS
jgi:hypothetical protein